MRFPLRTNVIASGLSAVTEVSTVPSAARFRIQWKVCARLSPSSLTNELSARYLASAASGSPVARNSQITSCHTRAHHRSGDDLLIVLPDVLRTIPEVEVAAGDRQHVDAAGSAPGRR